MNESFFRDIGGELEVVSVEPSACIRLNTAQSSIIITGDVFADDKAQFGSIGSVEISEVNRSTA